MSKTFTAWAILDRSESRLDGTREHLLFLHYSPLLFRTRREARQYINIAYGYIAERPDLRAEPHGRKMPRAVKVSVTIEVVT